MEYYIIEPTLDNMEFKTTKDDFVEFVRPKATRKRAETINGKLYNFYSDDNNNLIGYIVF